MSALLISSIATHLHKRTDADTLIFWYQNEIQLVYIKLGILGASHFLAFQMGSDREGDYRLSYIRHKHEQFNG